MTFEDAAREYLEVDEDDYYWEEYLSGLDHMDVTSLAEFAEYFYNAGARDVTEDVLC